MKEIKLTQGKVALVDDEEYEKLNIFKWCAVKNGRVFYAVRTIYQPKKKTIFMHKEILSKEGFYTDHKDHDGLNNQKINLRIATVNQNNSNKLSSKNSLSKYIGVSLSRFKKNNVEYKYWRAIITSDGVKYNLGSFKTELDAAIARDIGAKKYHKEFAQLNFPNI